MTQPDSIAKMYDELRAKDRAARESRIAAGMGFWRLSFVVAVGILIANVISGAAVWFVTVAGPPTP